jgi:hypothetical protein
MTRFRWAAARRHPKVYTVGLEPWGGWLVPDQAVLGHADPERYPELNVDPIEHG